jgi:uncharacterized protein (TIGR04255 family)
MTRTHPSLRADPDRSPTFERPPVVEVALAVSFDPVDRLTTADLGALWDREYRRRGFTVTEDQVPVGVVPEDFVSPTAGLPSVQVQLSAGIPTPRIWLMNEKGSELVQLQLDWFARNWRKAEPDMPYPRYSSVRDGFANDFKQLLDFLAAEELGALRLRTWEVTYVNHIFAGDGWDDLAHVEQVLRALASKWSPKFLTAPEFSRLSQQFVISGSTGEPVGRLHVTAEPGYKDGRDPMLLLTLTARGNFPESAKDLLDALDLGHEHVVNGFVDVTTSRMHDVWGLKHGKR